MLDYACIHVVIREATIAVALVDGQLGSQEFDEGAHGRHEAAAGWEYGVKPMCGQAMIGQEMDEPSVLDRRASQIDRHLCHPDAVQRHLLGQVHVVSHQRRRVFNLGISSVGTCHQPSRAVVTARADADNFHQ